MNTTLEFFTFWFGIAGALLAIFWFFYAFYVMYFVVPRADALVNPVLHGINLIEGDMLTLKYHRMCIYGIASGFRWGNNRVYPSYDFRNLPAPLRIHLALQFHFLILSAAGLIIGYLGMVLTDMYPVS